MILKKSLRFFAFLLALCLSFTVMPAGMISSYSMTEKNSDGKSSAEYEPDADEAEESDEEEDEEKVYRYDQETGSVMEIE